MAKRKTVTITIDADLWELSSIMLPCSRSSFIERQLRNYINSSNAIEELKEQIKKRKRSYKNQRRKVRRINKS